MLEEVKAYLRIDGSEEDTFLASLILASKEYITNATGVTVDESKDLHRLAVSLLVSHMYENRLPVGIGATAKGFTLPFSLESILTQMKYCYSEGV